MQSEREEEYGMPIEVGLWRLGDRLQKVEFCAIDSESRLESVLADDIGCH